MRKLTPPEEASWTEKTYSVEEAYDIGTEFFCELWPTFKLEIADREDASGDSTYRLFVETICGAKFDSYREWNDSIFRALQIPTSRQVRIKLSMQELFLATLEFCKLHNERFFGEIDLLVDRLEAMLADPEGYLFEWNIWKKTVEIVLSFEMHPFEWRFNPPQEGPPVRL